GGRPRRRERARDPGGRAALSAHGVVARGRGVSAARRSSIRRGALSGTGLAVALVVLAPYIVMVCTALKPERELRITPPRLTPIEWRPANGLGVPRHATCVG